MDYFEFNISEVQSFHRLIAKNVNYLRKEKDLTQLDLALSIGHKTMSTLEKIEAELENKHYNIEQLYKIAKVLDIDICEFSNLNKIILFFPISLQYFYYVWFKKRYA